ncbi:hypothetical protein [Mucilaginibacter sp. UR6-11]|uniref:hypothetical protein n=1 Tax=Mucilaginibacter sp. UR6-11 TaxID=1435644 RepID=UPI001E4845D7|nr:hypothetical protein [Mucilaginibacter sp. UR6-11]MCC8424795.1 hypothetical protein [Mucilaginibacter sp. UR6-11]
MKLELKHFLKSITLLLLCVAFFAGKSKPLAPSYQNNKHTTISKAFRNENVPANPFIKFNLIGGNQEAIRQVHKVNNPISTAYLSPQSGTACIKHFNFFSGYNDHRYTLQNADFLFPFHVFW